MTSNNIPLLLLQDTCFSITLALMLLMSHWHMRATTSR